MTIANVPTTSGAYQTIYLRKITITETAVAPELVLSPTSLSVACGTTKTQIFTVSNPNNVTGITGYNWNIGAAPNGWLYNGVAAPATISTTTNSISLTSVCGSIPKSISVNVMKGTAVYKTYTCTVSNTQQTYTITPNTSLCSGSATYCISPAPCNATITWSPLSPATGVATMTTAGNCATLTKTGNGTVTLQASITSSCSANPVIVSKQIPVGNPTFPTYTTNPSPMCSGQTAVINFNLPLGQSITSATGLQGGVQVPLYQYSPVSYELPGDVYQVTLTLQNACGTVTLSKLLQKGNCISSFSVYPNPADQEVTVEYLPQTGTLQIKKQENKSFVIRELKLYNQEGVLFKSLKMPGKKIIINTEKIPNGTYHLNIISNKEFITKQVIIQR